MGVGDIRMLPNMPPVRIRVTEPTWSVEGHELLEARIVHSWDMLSSGGEFRWQVPVMPVLQRHLLIIGDKDGNPVSEHHDKPVEKTKETT